MDAATVFAEPIQRLRADMDDTLKGIADVSTAQPSLGDLIRLGSSVTQQATNSFGDGVQACALSAAFIAAKANEIL